MNKKLLAGLATAAVLAGGGGAATLAMAGTASAAGRAAVPASTFAVPAAGPLGSLVAKGTITRAQATAIHNALVTYMRDHWQDMRRDCTGAGPDRTPWMLEPGGALDTVLSRLVQSGTVTKAQASAVTSAYTQWMRVGGHHGWGYHGHGAGMMGGLGSGMM